MSARTSETLERSRRPRVLVVALTVIVVILIALSITLVVMYTDPLKSVERTQTDWFGFSLKTQSEFAGGGPPFEAEDSMANYLCGPANAIGAYAVSFVWQSTSSNTSAVMFWESGSLPHLVFHPVYWVNNTSSGGYSFPPGVASLGCHNPPFWLSWTTPQAAQVTLNGVEQYNYTATEPIW